VESRKKDAQRWCCLQDEAFQNFTRLLLKVPEHTWGMDTKQAPQNWDVWSNAAFRKALTDSPLFAVAEGAWGRQAEYIQWGVEVCTLSLFHASYVCSCWRVLLQLPHVYLAFQTFNLT
jgi:hypothetical protein